MENNQSETAFVIVEENAQGSIRWFTPTTEVDLCGHATLAAAHVVLQLLKPTWNDVCFSSKGGRLSVHRDGESGRLCLDFPSLAAELWENAGHKMAQALNTERECTVFKSLYDVLVVFEEEETVAELKPDLGALRQLEDVRGVIVTSAGREADFVSRFFAPVVGIDEDPVTGSAHCVLVPFWSQRLEKTKLVARQLSKRGGELFCEDLRNGRVEIAGHTVLYSHGEICL